ncbi:MAG: hypothetical protein IPH12_02990 [Saprospirales bacterium]|jgi:hypothetical protein|nr:hypothetical protein [Saprospirales bacterium]MBK8921399.1 hypothetical protein [Saprospirales bacterium]
MRHIFVFFVCISLLAGCRFLRISDFHRQAPVSQPLPHLGLQVHVESFALLFGKELAERILVSNAIDPGSYIPPPVGILAQVGQPVHDVFLLLGNELNENFVQATGDQRGKARFKLIYYNRFNSGWGYTIPSVLTFGVVNIFGLPAKVTRSEMELQMEIVDNAGNVLAHYRAPGAGKAKVAMYYGYSGFGAMRKANLLALQDAMQGIKQQMEADLPELHTQLTADQPTR